jgi:Flp pilus assembly protein TadG
MSPFFAACLPVLLLACGFALDVGMLQLRYQQMQGAADAAVIAAELELERNNSSWATEGMQEASLNGYTNGANKTTSALSPLR